MNTKALLKQLIPPLIVDIIKKRSDPKVKYQNYQEATLACQQDAYHGDDLVKVVVDKNLNFRNELDSNPVFDLTTLRTLIPLASINNTNNSLSVIDFGGGGGYHYTIAKKALGNKKSINWRVVETSTMANEAQRLTTDQLKFFSDIDAARKSIDDLDLVFTSSALQYCPDPLAYLEKLIDLNAPYLFITRTPFVDSSEDIVTTQTSKLSANGPGLLPSNYSDRSVTYPITYVSKKKAEDLLNKKYDVRFRIDEGKGGFRFGDELITMMGYFCARKPIG